MVELKLRLYWHFICFQLYFIVASINKKFDPIAWICATIFGFVVFF